MRERISLKDNMSVNKYVFTKLITALSGGQSSRQSRRGESTLCSASGSSLSPE